VGLDQSAGVDDGAVGERADHLGGAEHARDRAGCDHAGAERRREVVAGADRDRDAGGQAGERGAARVQPAGDVGGVGEARQPGSVELERGEQRR
jgi:hypothetical protein